MSIDAQLLPLWFMWGAFLPTICIIIYSAFKVNVWALKQQPYLQHIFYCVCFGLTVLWCIRGGISSGLSVHFMGLTAATLLMGWALAIIAGGIALFIVSIAGLETYGNFAVNFMVSVCLPVLTSYFILKLVQRRLPKNPFIYIFLAGFFNGAFSILCVAITTSILLGVLDVYSWEDVYQNYLMYLPLMLFPEAFVNGMVIATIIGTKPELLSSFNVDAYFND